MSRLFRSFNFLQNFVWFTFLDSTPRQIFLNSHLQIWRVICLTLACINIYIKKRCNEIILNLPCCLLILPLALRRKFRCYLIQWYWSILISRSHSVFIFKWILSCHAYYLKNVRDYNDFWFFLNDIKRKIMLLEWTLKLCYVQKNFWSCIVIISCFQGYGQVFIQKVQQKHVLARNYFSRLPGMAEHLRVMANDRYTQPNGPAINGQQVPVQSKA